MDNAGINKNLYRIFLNIVKIMPNILAVIKILTLILNYLKITSFPLTCLGGTSIITLGILYLISHIFKFCGTHRISLHYTTLVHLLTIFDYYIGIPLDNDSLYRLFGIITGMFIISWIVVWYKNRNKPKIDHIKQFCDRYTC